MMKNKPDLLIFDVNETLLDMEKIRTGINKALSSESAFHLWFSRLLEFSSAETLTGNYLDFGEVGKAVLKMTAQSFAVQITDGQLKEILSNMTKLPPHPEVPEALEQLKRAGYRLVALTNGGKKTLENQFEYAQLHELFEEKYSVETIGKFKPHRDAYEFVLDQQKVERKKAMLIASHGWDVLGAQRAGLQTGFIGRPGKFLYPKGQSPEISGKDLNDLADKLVSLGSVF